MRITAGRQHLKHAVFDLEDRDIERAAAEVVYRDQALMALVEAVGERRRGRLVDDAHDVKAGDAAGVTGRRPLRVVEIRGNGYHRAIDLVVDFALGPEELLGPVLQIAQDERGDLRRRELAVAEPDLDDTARLAGHPERQQAGLLAYVVRALAHEALDGVHGPRRIRQQAPLGFAPHVDSAVFSRGNNGGHEGVVAAIADHDWRAVFHVGDEAVRGAEIDADNFGHGCDRQPTDAVLASSRSMPARRL